MERKIGLIGGMAALNEYSRQIAKRVDASKAGAGNFLSAVMLEEISTQETSHDATIHAVIVPHGSTLRLLNRAALEESLKAAAKFLVRQGVDALALTSEIMYEFAPAVTEALHEICEKCNLAAIPLLTPRDVIREECTRRSWSEIGLVGTRAVLETERVLRMGLMTDGIVVHNPRGLSGVDRIIEHEIGGRVIPPEYRKFLLEAMRSTILVGADGVFLCDLRLAPLAGDFRIYEDEEKPETALAISLVELMAGRIARYVMYGR